MAKVLEIHPATHLEGTVWRAVASDPPRIEDFRSYADLGRDLPTAQYLRLTSVSMFLSRSQLEAAQARYPSLSEASPNWTSEATAGSRTQ